MNLNMHCCKPSALALAVAGLCAAFVAPEAAALKLGSIRVQSTLGQPLRAEVSITDASAQEIDTLQARIASPATFRARNMEYGPVVPSIELVLHHRQDGVPVLRLRTAQPVNDLFIDLVLEASSVTGAHMRNYTLLLDPPARQSTTMATTGAQAQGAVPRSTPGQTMQISRPPAPRRSGASTQDAASGAGPSTPPSRRAARATASEGPITVRRGDTASKIAARHGLQGVSLDQMLVAMLQANPDAFEEGNMNRLKVGAVIRMPTQAQLQAVDAAEARRVVLAQSRDFNNYRRGVAGQTPKAQVQTADRASGGQVQASVRDASPASVPADRLTLSRSTQGAASNSQADQLAQQQQVAAVQARRQELQRNIDELRAMAQQSGQSAGVAPAAPEASPESTPPAPVASTAEGEPAVLPPVGATLPVVAQPPQPAVAVIVDTPAAPQPGVVSPPPKPVPTPVQSPEPSPPMTAQEKASLIPEGLLLPVGGGLLAVLLGALGFLGWRRMKARKAVFAQAQEEAPTAELPVAEFPAAMPESSVQEQDPIVQADAHLAYGHDAQAEEVLKNALRTDPTRLALHLKLAEIYARQHNLKQLESAARSILEISTGIGSEWEQVLALGYSMDPTNPFYAAAAAASTSAAPAPAPSGFAQALSQNALPDQIAPVAAPMPEAAGSTALDLDTDLDGPQDQIEIGDLLDANVSMASAASAVAPSPSLLDLDVELDALHSRSSADSVSAVSADGEDTPDDDDPLSTKLDLALEFNTIGDSEGARTLIEEVLRTATGSVRIRAEKMLANLAA